ncbi:MAG TPA: XRE family transcriptional regulator [Polyangiales bacterium]|nr:XRE family transcriptional regulator [Polyangiales bacterium]
MGAADLARRVGQRLRDEPQARNLSLDDLSRASGVSRAALSQIETRKSSPSLTDLEVGSSTYDLEAGDSLAFRADQAHSYGNPGSSEARGHNVIIYSRG